MAQKITVAVKVVVRRGSTKISCYYVWFFLDAIYGALIGSSNEKKFKDSPLVVKINFGKMQGQKKM
jgi:hypothetical protein